MYNGPMYNGSIACVAAVRRARVQGYPRGTAESKEATSPGSTSQESAAERAPRADRLAQERLGVPSKL